MQSINPKEINCDTEDVEYVLLKIEKSYNIKFVSNEMATLKTFGEFSDHIISKINLEEKNDCSSQQAFYKLKTAITKVTEIPEKEITPSATLEELFPIKRRKIFYLIEKELNLKLNAFAIPNLIFLGILVALLLSIVAIFFSWIYGVSGLVLTLLFLKIMHETTTEFSEDTIGGLVKKMMFENYLQSRRNPNSYNKAEIKKNLEALFIEELGLANEFTALADDTIMIN